MWLCIFLDKNKCMYVHYLHHIKESNQIAISLMFFLLILIRLRLLQTLRPRRMMRMVRESQPVTEPRKFSMDLPRLYISQKTCPKDIAMRYHTVVMTGHRMRVFECVSVGEIEEVVIKNAPNNFSISTILYKPLRKRSTQVTTQISKNTGTGSSTDLACQ